MPLDSDKVYSGVAGYNDIAIDPALERASSNGRAASRLNYLWGRFRAHSVYFAAFSCSSR